MRISDWSSDVCSSDLLCRWVRADLPYRCSSRGILPRQMILIHALTYLQIPRFFVINRRDDRGGRRRHAAPAGRDRKSHTSEHQSLMRISYAVFCLKKKTEYNPLNSLYLRYYTIRPSYFIYI